MHTVPLMSRIELFYEIYKMSNFLRWPLQKLQNLQN